MKKAVGTVRRKKKINSYLAEKIQKMSHLSPEEQQSSHLLKAKGFYYETVHKEVNNRQNNACFSVHINTSAAYMLEQNIHFENERLDDMLFSCAHQS